MARILRIQKMIANSSFDNNTKAVLQFLKIVMYFGVFVHFMACIWWWGVVQDGSPQRYGKDYDINGYTSLTNETYKDERGLKVPINEDISFQWG